MDTSKNAVHEFQQATNDLANNKYVLQLYIAGSSPRSRRAIVNVQKICQEFFKDVYELQVIDIFQQPLLAKVEQIIAVPTLIKKLPIPKRLYIGDMSNAETIIENIDS